MAGAQSYSGAESSPQQTKHASHTIQVEGPPTPDEALYDDFENAVPRTVDELIRLRARQQGKDEAIIAYPDNGTNYVDYSPRALDDLVETAACHYSEYIPQRTSSDDPVEVIGILGVSDLDYLVSFLAVSRLGHAALLLSTRITIEAYDSLLETTKATALLHQSQFSDVAQNVQSSLAGLNTISICNVTQLPPGKLQDANLDPEREANNPSFIIHSSGSTGLPKPIVQTHKASLYAYSQHFGLVGHITLPLYHNHGICCFFRAIYSRRKIYIYNARLPLTSQHLLATLREHRDIRILYGVPYALKLLSESNEGINLLSSLDIVMFGGSACPKPIGDKLVESGVNLVGHYGATEVGQLMTSFRNHAADKDWDWLRVPDRLAPYLSMEERGPGLFELCVREGWPSKVATNREDGSYATKDLFVPHPEIAHAWQYYARLDDTLTLENGEKANPLLLEGVLRQNANVAEAVVFGAGKPHLGAFIIPAMTNSLSNDELLNDIMPSVEKANHGQPAYARLSRDMIKMLSHNAGYRQTDKGTVIRAAFYRDYAKKIDETYVDTTTGTLVLAKSELLNFLHENLRQKLKLDASITITNDTDLFALGVDSLLAIQIRSLIIKTLKVDSSKLGRNFVFDFPTITQMAAEILRIQNNGPEVAKKSVEERMTAMIERQASFKAHLPLHNNTSGKFMVVTGVTGSLGAHAVTMLASQSSVSKIYCLVRTSDTRAAYRRVWQSLRERCLLHTTLPKARSKIVALPSDLSNEFLGLERAQYDTVASNLTHVLHFAWSVNFNKGLESFEKDCVAGAKNLVNLCLSAQRPQPAQFSFCSSVSTTARTPGCVVPESLPESLSCAQGMGYAQSKLVTEHLCDIASKRTGIRARVLRVGQIIGDTQHGIWNDTEAIPMIFRTAERICALPKLNERPSWLPVDQVARSCIEISCSAAPSGVYNVVNHNTFHWTHDLLPLLREAGLKFDEVDQREWVQKLRTSDPDPATNPPIKLLDFFANKYDNDLPHRSLIHNTGDAQSYSLTLQNASSIDAILVKKIMNDLRRRWTVDDTRAPSNPIATFICGPCGSGKSTIAKHFSSTMSIPMIEGDDLHAATSKVSMGRGIALTDAERLIWLSHIRGAILDRINTSGSSSVMVTCSALKASYRDELRWLEEIAGVRTVFVMLATDNRDRLRERLECRAGHYMGSKMVDGQIDCFEECEVREVDTVTIDAAQDLNTVMADVEDVLSVV